MLKNKMFYFDIISVRRYEIVTSEVYILKHIFSFFWEMLNFEISPSPREAFIYNIFHIIFIITFFIVHITFLPGLDL